MPPPLFMHFHPHSDCIHWSWESKLQQGNSSPEHTRAFCNTMLPQSASSLGVAARVNFYLWSILTKEVSYLYLFVSLILFGWFHLMSVSLLYQNCTIQALLFSDGYQVCWSIDLNTYVGKRRNGFDDSKIWVCQWLTSHLLRETLTDYLLHTLHLSSFGSFLKYLPML
jgi:hypothetical protein